MCRALCRLLYDELGFRGNEADYYDPRNSFLNVVLSRRIGIPITLAIVVVEVARRAGLEAHGVGFPAHFLVRVEGLRAPLMIDPFHGRLLTPDELRALHERATGRSGEVPPELLWPASKRQVLLRMLNNLRAIYSTRSEREPLRAVLERMLVLEPDDEQLLRQLASLDGEPEDPDGSGSAASN
jgi:regulator of sirC expression with transglutaminase-like and TPR domain